MALGQATRIAAISDIHGNSLALNAVLDDAHTQGVDEIWALGDLVALGPDPVGVVEGLTSVKGCRVISGSTDRYVLGPWPAALPEVTATTPARASIIEAMTARFSWTAKVLSAAGLTDWLTSLPLQFTETLPDGQKVMAVHASPGRDDGPGLGPHRSRTELQEEAQRSGSDLLLAGHTHLPFDRHVGGTRLINLGSVAYSRPQDLRASYVLITASSRKTKVEHRRVPYDVNVTIDHLRRVNHPYPDYLIGLLRGEGFHPL
jgi:predicted phosphodiesterase